MNARTSTVIMALALVGCSTPYQRAGFLGGYTSEPLGNRTYLIAVHVNGGTDPAVAYTYFHRRARELCRGEYDVLDENSIEKIQAGIGKRRVEMVADPQVFGRVQCRAKNATR